MTLAATQAALAAAVQRADDAATARAAELASGSDRLSPRQQVDVYREQFWLRHRGCLADDFAALAHLVGGEAFDELARAYLAACPPASFTLRDLGERLPSFLTETAPWSADPLVAELARVEWAFVEAFDAADAPPFDGAAIAGAPDDAWPAAQIVFHPALRRLALAYPSHDYRIDARKGEATRPEPRACQVVVYRGAELLHALEIEPDAAALLDALASGTALGAACERVAAASGLARGAFQAKLPGWFAAWTSMGWIRAVRF